MDETLVKYLLKGAVDANVGPTAREIFLLQAEEEYKNGNMPHAIFYQIRALFQAVQERFYEMETDLFEQGEEEAMAPMSAYEAEDIKSNVLMQYVLETLRNDAPKVENFQYKSCNFLRDIIDPSVGIKKVEEICAQFPNEWTVLQLCKGMMPESTYSTFKQLHKGSAAIYLTILRHARTLDYPMPICLRFSGTEQTELFEKFASIADRFKQCINIDPSEWNTRETKKKYWDTLGEFNQFLAVVLTDLKNFFYPWRFLFAGKPKKLTQMEIDSVFAIVDAFCLKYDWEANKRVLLSLVALHVKSLSELEINAICNILTNKETEQSDACDMLKNIKGHQVIIETKAEQKYKESKHYPCILVVDERLDHFFWEEINVEQEFTRVNSLQCLNRLYQLHKQRIHSGYLKVNISNGGCVINPDNNLPKTELRMRHFFEYWTPHWRMKFTEKPKQDDMLNDFFKRPCFVYAGHGSGLQYLSGKNIAKQRMNCVVFLFGCDSARMYSTGLYSELFGTHLYYHAAMCPTLVGTILPALDSYMDLVATEILSHWIAPNSKHVLPWNQIDCISWLKEGIIKSQCETAAVPSVATTPTYHSGSLCAILARVHQRINEPKFYNTVSYVCRGLPAWNCDVEALP